VRILGRSPRYAVTQDVLTNALMSATKSGALAVVDFLLREITQFLPETSEVLTTAITTKHFGVVERLLPDPRINISVYGALKGACQVQNVLDDPRGLSAEDKSEALVAACGLPETDVLVRLLADPNIDPNQSELRQGIKEFPLVETCDSTKLDFFRALLAHPKIDLKGRGVEAIVACCRKGLMEHLKELLARPEIDLNQKYGGEMPLEAACSHKQTKVAELLLRHGVDPNVQEREHSLLQSKRLGVTLSPAGCFE